MPIVDLSKQEWDQIIAVLVEVPWRIANPLLLKITPQLQAQQPPSAQPAKTNSGDSWGTGNEAVNALPISDADLAYTSPARKRDS
jgi:hypothetical protein